MKTYFLTVSRHFIAALVGALMGMLTTNIPLTEDAAAEVETALSGMALMAVLFGYALAEKTLKPLFQKWAGEIQPGEVTPEITDRVKATGHT